MKRRSVIVSAALTIALCVCLVAGSTYAIFTSSDQFNIAANSANVNIVATVTDISTYENLNGAVTNENSAKEADGSVLFMGNKGYVKLTDDKLEVANMAPGDGFKVNIDLDNSGTNVAIQYRVVLIIKGELAPALTATVSNGASADGINVPVDSATVADSVQIASAWELIDVSQLADMGPLTVDILFPNGAPEHDNLFKDKACEIAVRIEVVQGNADTTDIVVP